MRRFFYLLPITFAALSLILLAVQPTEAQPPVEARQQEDQPNNGTPPPVETKVDWANVQMEGEGEGDFPHAGTREPDTPPASGTPVAPDAGAPKDSVPEAAPEEATPPATAPATVPPGQTTYVVRAGDTLYELARLFGIPLSQLIAANHIPDPRRLDIGQVLVIPVTQDGLAEGDPSRDEPVPGGPSPSGEQTYVVKRGDTPYRIAQRFGVELQAIIAANRISDPRRLAVGQVLTIPAPGHAPVSAATPVAAPVAPAAVAESGAIVYVVQRGDTLNRIARSYSISMQALVDANRLHSPDRIMAGQTLTIPGTTAKNPPESAPAAQADTEPTPAPTQPPPEPTNPPTGNGTFIWPIPLHDG